ncbi:hypothetical protein RchiOBHm_Chr2g0159901 [Rosa chinensis]|uniref:Uncharacterized protein n=1 Tax=Rosa chinensis TaxID=74649 RepID=A0A2P6S2D4_ROSCH|nr:hypothetical protein RchiOBHm_Chr2g0159901 [Rosa chinensis]
MDRRGLKAMFNSHLSFYVISANIQNTAFQTCLKNMAYLCFVLFDILEEYDTHDPTGHCAMVLPFLRKRSKIIEIVAAHDIVFALAQSGVCAAFSRDMQKPIRGYAF